MGGGGATGSSGGQLFSGSAVSAGQMSIFTSAPGLTRNELDPLWEFKVAAMAVCPGPLAAAKPNGLTVATEGLLALQSAVRVRSCWVPSLNVPVAMNWCPPPDVTPASPGETLMPLKLAALMFKAAAELATP